MDKKLLNRRTLLRSSAIVAGAGVGRAFGLGMAEDGQSIGANSPEWMKTPGRVFSPYGMPSKRQAGVKRLLPPPESGGTGSSRTPLHSLEGIITPSGLHFERYHNGIPDIDPDRHELFIHGLVKRPLAFSVEALSRYPMVTEIRFIECAGNSGSLALPQPQQTTAGGLHGLISCSEWTGVRLSTLLEEAGVEPDGRWVIAEGADSAAVSRSVPIEKCMDDALIALYQNGEALRAEQGYPIRLLLPGFEGNMNIKWLRRLNVVRAPVDARDETSHYSELMANGRARQYMLVQDVKSCITKPSFGMTMKGPGDYEISGLAWSGAGKVAKVDVSVNGGHTWVAADLSLPVLSKALTRFRMPWHWDGRPSVLMSRATDEKGITQPTRSEWVAQYAPGQPYHFNGIQSWGIDEQGTVTHVYA